ncbi:hypothetical protein SDC9_150279 [bioreactor metagenome]|uniref:Uncharacterized protein n=1 Tax=bioreactor metagenome TaxID=1076179 RepID=A0A645ENN7_9ZZZZ
MAKSICLTGFNNVPTFDHGAFADGHHAVVGGIIALVFHQELGQFFHIEGHLRNDGAIHIGKIRRDQAGFT